MSDPIEVQQAGSGPGKLESAHHGPAHAELALPMGHEEVHLIEAQAPHVPEFQGLQHTLAPEDILALPLRPEDGSMPGPGSLQRQQSSGSQGHNAPAPLTHVPLLAQSSSSTSFAKQTIPTASSASLSQRQPLHSSGEAQDAPISFQPQSLRQSSIVAAAASLRQEALEVAPAHLRPDSSSVDHAGTAQMAGSLQHSDRTGALAQSCQHRRTSSRSGGPTACNWSMD